MTYSYTTKQELCKLQNKKTCCQKAECYALLLFTKALSPRTEPLQLENNGVARRMAELTGLVTGFFPVISVQLTKRRGSTFFVPETEVAQLRAFFLHQDEAVATHNHVNHCCAAAFLRGAFLACGTLADPTKQYQLDFILPTQALAIYMQDFLTQQVALGLQPGLIQRQGSFVLYYRGSAQIQDLLTYIGATNASMELMQIKMYKEAVNNINRKSNFETANMDKTYSASARQTAAIAAINDFLGLDNLEPSLQEAARLRLENPDMTLNDLAKALGISRSGVNHKMQKLLKLGVQLMEDAGQVALAETIGGRS